MATKGSCSFGGCNKPAFSKGLCGAHYQQQRKGQPLKPLQLQYHGLTERERFEAHVKRKHRGCWPWTGAPTRLGYGQFRNAEGRPELAHRVAWRLYRGTDPGDQLVLHTCDNGLCMNPNHLYLGTQQDNVDDMWARGGARPGVSRGEDHGCAKLTEAAVREIRASNETDRTLAQKYGVSRTQIYDIRKRRSWKHID